MLLFKLEKIFSLDLRAIAFLRMASACLILIDLFQRSLTLTRDYTDNGVLPRTVLTAHRFYLVPIHLMTGSAEGQIFLFIVAAIFAIGLLIGYKTKLCSVLSWLFFISLLDRNFFITSGADDYLKMVLFWGMFLPWEQRYAIDSIKTIGEIKSNSFSSLATLGFVVQVCLIYFMAGNLKNSPLWTNGTALYYILSTELYDKPVGHFMLHYPSFLNAVSIGVPYFEKYVALLLLCPFFTPYVRTMGVLIIILFHIGILLTLELTLFPFVCIAAVIALLPTEFWDRFLKEPVTNKIAIISSGAMTIPKNIFLMVALIYIILFNFSALPHTVIHISKTCRFWGRVLHINQKWNLYSQPDIYSNWYVVKGSLKNTQEVNAITGGPLDFNKPAGIKTDNGERNRKLFIRLKLDANAVYRIYYARFLCEDWNSSHRENEQMKRIQILSMKQTVPLDHQEEPVYRKSLIDYACP